MPAGLRAVRHPPGAVGVVVRLVAVRAFEHGGDAQGVVRPGGACRCFDDMGPGDCVPIGSPLAMPAFVFLDATRQKQEIPRKTMSDDSRKVMDDVRQFLRRQHGPVSTAELAQKLGVSPWQIREAIWRLTAASEAELTEDWKLRGSTAAVEAKVPEPA